MPWHKARRDKRRERITKPTRWVGIYGCVELKKGDVWNEANKSDYGIEKPKQCEISLLDYCLKAPIFPRILYSVRISQLSSDHMWTMLNIGVFTYWRNFIRLLLFFPFLIHFSIAADVASYQWGFGYLLKMAKVFDTLTVCINPTEWDYFLPSRLAFRLLNTTRKNLSLVAMTIITKNSSLFSCFAHISFTFSILIHEGIFVFNERNFPRNYVCELTI